MNIHEYQAKRIISTFGVKLPDSSVIENLSEASLKESISKVGFPMVVKAQIHAGGRGKGGGVKLCKREDEFRSACKQIFGMNLVTHQTSQEGRKVKKLLIESSVAIKRELYLGMVIDREKKRVCIMASEEGGVEIELVAARSPEKIRKVWVDPALGLMPSQIRELGFFLKLKGEAFKSYGKILKSLYDAFESKDGSLMEVNPLVETEDGKIVVLDCKMNFDDNSLFRHDDIVALRDLDEEDPLETEASRYNLNYIKLDGNIGCMVNGAGLAMATMDIIKLTGGEPANFLDVGGGASEEQIENGFRIILSDTNVKCIFINIFGGILRCDRLAKGVVNGARKLGLEIPVVIRMEGTNFEEGSKILKESNLPLIVADSMKDGAMKAVKALKQ